MHKTLDQQALQAHQRSWMHAARLGKRLADGALARTLVHEIGHLLNDRAISLILPSWLEEGMASDLGSLWVEPIPGARASRDSNNAATTWAGLWNFVTNGIDANLMSLSRTLEAGRLPSVAVLMNLERKTFLGSSAYTYAHSAAFVRYLLDSEDGRQGEVFRLFLKRVAIGHGADPALLLKLLEMDVPELDAKFRAWLRAEAAIVDQRLNPS